MLKLVPPEKSMPFPCIVAFPLNFNDPVCVSTKSEYLSKTDSGFEILELWVCSDVGELSSSVAGSLAHVSMQWEAAGTFDAFESFKVFPSPRFAANPILLCFETFGTAGAEIKFVAAGLLPGDGLNVILASRRAPSVVIPDGAHVPRLGGAAADPDFCIGEETG
jgi:hypothetical protein